MDNAKDALCSAKAFAEDAKDSLNELLSDLCEIENYLDNEDEIEELKEKIKELEGEKEEWEARESVLIERIEEMKRNFSAIEAICFEVGRM